MWRISDRERTILGNLMQVCAAEDDDAPTNPFERIEIPFERRNGETVRVSLEDVMKKDRLSCDELEAIREALPEGVEFHKFVECLQPHFIPLFPNDDFPPPPSEVDKIEHNARLERLRTEQANRKYAEMTKSVDPRGAPENLMEGFGKELGMMNRQLTVVINTLITVAGAFAFGFFGIQLAYPQWGADMATKVLIGLALATLVFFADLYFIVKNMDMDMDMDMELQREEHRRGSGTNRVTAVSKEKKDK